MPWFRVDDGAHGHPKMRRAGLAAIGLWTLAGSHSMNYKTDGFVPDWFVKGFPQGARLADKLVSNGLWHNATREGEEGYEFHHWDHVNPTAEEIERDRERARNRQRDFRQRLRDGKKKKEGE